MDWKHARTLILVAGLLLVAAIGTSANASADEDSLWSPMANGKALTEGLLVYDPDHELVVAFGGRQKHVNKSSTVSDDVLVLDAGIETGDWQDVSRRIAGRSPGNIYASAGVYWPTRQEMVFFAGKGNGNKVVALDLAKGIDGLRWSQPRVSGTATGRASHTAVYAPELDQMLVFGGTSGNAGNSRQTLGDVVAVTSNGTGFSIKTLPVPEGPGPRLDHSAVYDPVNKWMIVYGGALTYKTATYNELWALDMNEPVAPRWIDLNKFVTGDTPGARKAHTAVYDPMRQQMVVYGGRGATAKEIWALNLADGLEGLAWVKHAEADAPDNPQGLSDHGAVWVPEHDCMIVYGGTGRAGENAGAWMYHPKDSTGHNWRPDPGPRCDDFDPDSACGAKMTTRVFIDRRCDGFYNPGYDALLVGADVTVEIPFSGRVETLLSDHRGRAYFSELDVPAALPLKVSVEHESAGAVCGYEGSTLLVPGSRFGSNDFAVLTIGLAPAR